MKKNNSIKSNELPKISSSTKNIIKNYFLVILMFGGVIAVVLYLCHFYNVSQENKRQIPVIRDVLYEIKSDEFDHYVLENPTAMIYMCTASDISCRDYEKDLKKFINNSDNLRDNIIYLNLSDSEKNDFHKKFNAKYKSRFKLSSNYPAMVLLEDGKVTGVLQANSKKRLTMKKTKEFLELHKIGENDYELEENDYE